MNDTPEISATARDEMLRGLAASLDKMLEQPGAAVAVQHFLEERAVFVVSARTMLALPVDDLAATLRKFIDVTTVAPDNDDDFRGGYI